MTTLQRYGLLLGLLLLVACGAPAPLPTPTANPTTAAMIPVLAASELVVGSNRLPLGIIRGGVPINDPNLTLQLRFFYLGGTDKTTVRGETAAIYRGQRLPIGLYVAHATFDVAGAWSIEVTIPRANSAPQVSRIRIEVLATSVIPSVGEKAIPSHNLTIREVPDLKQLTSDPEPDPALYQLTIADAIAAKKPFVVIMATPGYCQTAVCAPNMLVVKELKTKYGQRANFIHVEVYPYPFNESFQKMLRVPTLEEWHLQTEPWLFLVDANGIIQSRYEGGITLQELEPDMEQLTGGAG